MKSIRIFLRRCKSWTKRFLDWLMEPWEIIATLVACLASLLLIVCFRLSPLTVGAVLQLLGIGFVVLGAFQTRRQFKLQTYWSAFRAWRLRFPRFILPPITASADITFSPTTINANMIAPPLPPKGTLEDQVSWLIAENAERNKETAQLRAYTDQEVKAAEHRLRSTISRETATAHASGEVVRRNIIDGITPALCGAALGVCGILIANFWPTP